MKTIFSLTATAVFVLTIVGFASAGERMSKSYDMGGIWQNGVTSFSQAPDCTGAGGAGAGGLTAEGYNGSLNTISNGVTSFGNVPITKGACFGRTESSSEGAILYNGVTDFGVIAHHKKM